MTKGTVYILTNIYDKVLYTGVTSNLRDRLRQHIDKKHRESFSARYNLYKLVYFEECETIGDAILNSQPQTMVILPVIASPGPRPAKQS